MPYFILESTLNNYYISGKSNLLLSLFNKKTFFIIETLSFILNPNFYILYSAYFNIHF